MGGREQAGLGYMGDQLAMSARGIGGQGQGHLVFASPGWGLEEK